MQAEVVVPMLVTVMLEVVMGVLVFFLILLLLEAGVVRLTGTALIIVMVLLEVLEAEALLRTRILEPGVQERRVKGMPEEIKILDIQLLIPEEVVEVPEPQVVVVVALRTLEELDNLLILQEVL